MLTLGSDLIPLPEAAAPVHQEPSKVRQINKQGYRQAKRGNAHERDGISGKKNSSDKKQC